MLADEILAVRTRAGLFRHGDRGVLAVTGSDARRWLNGMVTNDVARLEAGPDRSGCRALVLTHRGRIVADVQVLQVTEGFWLEAARAALPGLQERLSKLLIADDVVLTDRSADLAQFGVEGPAAAEILARALGEAPGLAPDACREATLGTARVVVARFGFSGEEAFQVFGGVPLAEDIRAALVTAAAGGVLPSCSPEALEVLRIEAGRPRLGAELSEEILPPEARLESSISYTKGCYTGQEIVARLRSRGHVNHLLVGLRFAGDPPAAGAPVLADGKAVGEITSATRSPQAGAIALAFVRVGSDAPGTRLDVAGSQAMVSALPFVTPSAR